MIGRHLAEQPAATRSGNSRHMKSEAAGGLKWLPTGGCVRGDALRPLELFLCDSDGALEVGGGGEPSRDISSA